MYLLGEIDGVARIDSIGVYAVVLVPSYGRNQRSVSRSVPARWQERERDSTSQSASRSRWSPGAPIPVIPCIHGSASRSRWSPGMPIPLVHRSAWRPLWSPGMGIPVYMGAFLNAEEENDKNVNGL